MPIQSGSLQTYMTDTGFTGILDGQVTGMDVVDATENEVTSLLEAEDPFNVVLSWELTGAGTSFAGGYWFVTLYSNNMDAVGTMVGQLGTTSIQIVGGPSPLQFQTTFQVSPPVPQPGLYKLTATINHSPTQSPAEFDETFGYAEGTPIQITATDPLVDSN